MSERGFTLLELLMVVIIIGILSSIAVPQYLKSARRARTGEALQMLAAIRSSEMRFQAQTGAYTATLASLDITVPCIGGAPVDPCEWGYAVNIGTARAQANGNEGGATLVEMNLNTGATCSAFADYGLSATC